VTRIGLTQDSSLVSIGVVLDGESSIVPGDVSTGVLMLLAADVAGSCD